MLKQLSPTLPVPATDPRRIALSPYCKDHQKQWGIDDFDLAVEGKAGPEQLMKAVHMLTLVEGTAVQLREFKAALEARYAYVANEGATFLTPDITSFVTQQLHMSLDIYPQLISTRLCSIQPLNQPAAYVFYLTRVSGEASPRPLATLQTFNKNYARSAGENTLIPTIHPRLTGDLVECEYYKLRWEHSHEVSVKMRSQFGLDPEALMDPALVSELAWEVDRTVIDRLVAFTTAAYYFDPTNGGTYNAMVETERAAYEKRFLRVTLAQATTDIERSVYRSPNWAIAGSNVIKWLKRLPEFTTRNASVDGVIPGSQSIRSGSIIASGELEGMMVWHDPQLDQDLMLIGYTEQASPFYAGFIMAPFGLATAATAAWQDPDYLVTKKSRVLAFATKGITAGQYARIYLRAGS